jgi:hypothetical protein
VFGDAAIACRRSAHDDLVREVVRVIHPDVDRGMSKILARSAGGQMPDRDMQDKSRTLRITATHCRALNATITVIRRRIHELVFRTDMCDIAR